MIIVPILPIYGGYAVLPPVEGKVVSGLKANLDLILVTANESERLVPFRIDPGATCSTMSLAHAERLGLLKPEDQIADLRVRTASEAAIEQTLRIGKLIVRLPSLRASPFEWPAVFNPTMPSTNPPLLGLAGVIADLNFEFKGDPIPHSEYGSVTITLRNPGNSPP
jgi:hypothetical protein